MTRTMLVVTVPGAILSAPLKAWAARMSVGVAELPPDDPSITEPVVASDGDPYEGYSEDDLHDMQDPLIPSQSRTR